MGFFLFLFAAAALTAGLVVSTGLVVMAVLFVRRNATRRAQAWRSAAIGFVVGLALVAVAIQFLPLRPVSPGSDYDALAFNWVLQGFAYGLAPGLAALVGAGSTWARPRIDRRGKAAADGERS